MNTLFRTFSRMLSGDSNMTTPSSTSAASSSNMHFPSTRQHIYSTIDCLRKASSLPDELLKTILYYADYDCLHFSASSDRKYTAYSRGPQGAEPFAYVSTPPLRDIHEAGVRIRSIRLSASGHDQGFVSDRSAGVWSYFAVRRMKDPQNGIIWAQNEMASRNWQDHELSLNLDDLADETEEGEVRTALRQMISQLDDGDGLCIVPMAKFAGWQCHVQKAEIDVEVEVWR
ncbi:uncharacterized protein MYCGRDRAFT_110886 [Zymoseptoria tritici IPO323]|uniref:Uncharacterized protein n=1 Tax=Zymoseptoria tritici (strain CBS 115943 / IPO323) TaxID=336722 RepID=F9XKE6_ZYMTI|nr:uncharacterized protein MYCGRDRAFT_110886 [Zymoseptoria tritici IPO323]EGP84511.1 hypothetical protein MYCGRDRAFT_110886 [Zymoseptoria tritici IPO323]